MKRQKEVMLESTADRVKATGLAAFRKVELGAASIEGYKFLECSVVPEMPLLWMRSTNLTHGALMLYEGEVCVPARLRLLLTSTARTSGSVLRTPRPRPSTLSSSPSLTSRRPRTRTTWRRTSCRRPTCTRSSRTTSSDPSSPGRL